MNNHVKKAQKPPLALCVIDYAAARFLALKTRTCSPISLKNGARAGLYYRDGILFLWIKTCYGRVLQPSARRKHVPDASCP